MRSIFLILFIFLAALAQAQYSRKADSLRLLLKNASDDTMRFKNLARLANEVSNYDMVEAKRIMLQALEQAQRKNWKRKEMIAYSNLGVFASEGGDRQEAIQYHSKYLALATALHDSDQIGNALYELSVGYMYFADYAKSQDYAYQSLKIAEKRNDKMLIYQVYAILGTLLLEMDRYDEALDVYRKELAIAESEGSQTGIALVNRYIGNVYFELKDSANALQYFKEELRIDRETGNKLYEANCLINIGSVYSSHQDYAKALSWLQQGMEINEELGSKPNMIANLIDISKVYRELGKIDLAEKLCRKGLKLAREISERKGEATALDILGTIYEKQGRYKEALDAFRKAGELSDSLMSNEIKEDLTRRELTYEFGKKAAADSTKAAEEKKILAAQNHLQEVQLSRSRFFIYGLVGFCLLALVIAYLFIRQNKLRSSQRAMQLEQKLLRSQMNPHFIFNSLGAIESYIYENQPKAAGRYLSDFARLMRMILESSSQEYIPLSREITILEYYLNLQKLRYGERLNYTIRLNEEIDPEELSVPPMLSQPFIENALEHGLKQSQSGGTVIISFDLEADKLMVKVEDNGIGIEAARTQNMEAKKHQSKALQITKERLAILNRKNNRKVDFTIIDRSQLGPGLSGTLVAFGIPL